MIETPNLDKAREVHEVSQAQGLFVDYLAGGGAVLCEYRHFWNDPDVTLEEHLEADRHSAECGWHPITNRETFLNRKLAEYHEINFDEMNEERERVYQALKARS